MNGEKFVKIWGESQTRSAICERVAAWGQGRGDESEECNTCTQVGVLEFHVHVCTFYMTTNTEALVRSLFLFLLANAI
jgi:hypothetical protein